MAVVFALVFAMAATACSITAIRSWRSRSSNPAARALASTLGGCAGWSLADLLTTVGLPAEVQLWAVKLSYIGIYLTVLGLCALSRMIIDPSYRPRRATVALVLTPASVLLAIAITAPVPGPFFRSIDDIGSPGYARLHFGPLFYVHAGYCYLLLGVALVYVLRERRRAAPVFRRQLNYFLASAIIPVAGNVASVVAPELSDQRDLTPVFFTITALLVARVLSQGLLRIIPVARARVIESISDCVLVIDAGGRIVDVNPSARALVHQLRPEHEGELVGVDATGLVDVLVDNCNEASVDGRTVEVLPGRFVDLRTTVISDHHGRIVGRVIMGHDITDLVQARNEIEKQLHLVDQLRSELVEQTLRDPLTGAYNRRYLDEALRNALAEADRSGRPVAVLVLDIDHFKSVNDLHGHQAGDAALVAIVQTLAAQARGHDAIARLGGEEFVVVLPGAGRAEAMRRAEQFRIACSADIVEVQAVTGPPLHLTVSIGCALYPQDGRNADEVIAAADRAMYVAKSNGRNRVVDASDVTLTYLTT